MGNWGRGSILLGVAWAMVAVAWATVAAAPPTVAVARAMVVAAWATAAGAGRWRWVPQEAPGGVRGDKRLPREPQEA